jgi:hypothetical protein
MKVNVSVMASVVGFPPIIQRKFETNMFVQETCIRDTDFWLLLLPFLIPKRGDVISIVGTWSSYAVSGECVRSGPSRCALGNADVLYRCAMILQIQEFTVTKFFDQVQLGNVIT